MPSDQPELIERLFHEALELHPADRAAFLDRACAGDAEARAELESLLAAAGAAAQNPAWRDSAMVHEARRSAAVPDASAFERYQILARIGAGGMGVVYKAVRSDEIGQVVALKVMQSAADPQTLTRFLQERRILARLEHPNIARMIDAGTTREGQPFLAMEYVEGRSLGQYLREAGLSVTARLRLFQRICAAVASAHRSLIVHRDLKPGNILVTREGEPKLVDFGIATLLDGSAMRTRTGAAALTPEYASPEQVRGEPITTASDIYSLGVILYEMLAGESPYPKTASPLALAEAITSGAAVTLNRGAAHFDPDLNVIVAMAMRREPERRYATVEQFASDVERYLGGYPVTARPDTRSYRARKFMQRNRVALVAAGLVALAIVGGVAATLRQASIANQRFRDVRTLANTYLFEIHDAIKDLPGSTAARQLVLTRAQQYLERLARERGNDAELGLELAQAYGRIGFIQGQAGGVSLGDRPAALASYRKAVEILEPIVTSAPRNLAPSKELGQDYAEISHLYGYMGDVKSAVEYARKAVDRNQQLAAVHPNDPDVHEWLGMSYFNLGDLLGNPNYQNLGNAKAAVAAYRQAEPILAKIRETSAPDSPRRSLLGTLYGREAQMDQALDDRASAVEHYRKALAIDEEALAARPLSQLAQWDAAAANRNLALSLVRAGRAAEGEAYADKALALFEQFSRQDPANPDGQNAVADAVYAKGYLRSELKDPAGALTFYRRAIALYDQIAASHPASGSPPGLRTAYQLAANAYLATRNPAGAIDAAEKELAIDATLLHLDANNASAQRNQALANKQIGQAHQLAGRLREASESYRKALALFEAQKAKGTLTPMYAGEIAKIQASLAECTPGYSGRKP